MKTTSTTALTNDEYRSTPHWSNSDLGNVKQGAAIYEWARDLPSQATPAIELGTFLHSLILEPEIFNDEYVKAPAFDLRTKSGKEGWARFESLMAGSGKSIIQDDQWSMLQEMKLSIMAHPSLRRLFTCEGQSEVSIFGNINGIPVKIRPDRITIIDGKHYMTDLKKTADLDTFVKSAVGFGYHRQQAFYSDVYEQLTGIKPIFAFGVIGEKKQIGRHPCKYLSLPEWLVDLGRTEYLEALEEVREYEAFGFNDLEPEELFIPAYLKRK